MEKHNTFRVYSRIVKTGTGTLKGVYHQRANIQTYLTIAVKEILQSSFFINTVGFCAAPGARSKKGSSKLVRCSKLQANSANWGTYVAACRRNSWDICPDRHVTTVSVPRLCYVEAFSFLGLRIFYITRRTFLYSGSVGSTTFLILCKKTCYRVQWRAEECELGSPLSYWTLLTNDCNNGVAILF